MPSYQASRNLLSLNARLLRTAEPFIAPASVILIAVLAAVVIRDDAVTPMRLLPAIVLPVGIFLSLWFNRGRAFLALVSLFLGYAGYLLALRYGAETFAVRAVLSGIAIFFPLNVTLILFLPERGVFHFRSYRWLLLLVVQTVLLAWVASAGHSPLSGAAWQTVVEHWLLRPEPTPVLGRILFAAGIALAIARVYEQVSPVEIGLGSALLAFFVACTWVKTPGSFAVFITAAGLILLLSVLQESRRMAFRDELTGLPGRRMLEEQLLGLGPEFTIAMVDIDHFKKFNDTYGHDIGDQVLRMVGAHLADVGGNGRAFRYGGEEFAILFPDKSLDETLPNLENLRVAIEDYTLVPRTHERRRSERDNKERRLQHRNEPAIHSRGKTENVSADQSLSVTVSIGVSQRNRRLHTPAIVLRAADEELYRAKQAGRNRLSH